MARFSLWQPVVLAVVFVLTSPVMADEASDAAAAKAHQQHINHMRAKREHRRCLVTFEKHSEVVANYQVIGQALTDAGIADDQAGKLYCADPDRVAGAEASISDAGFTAISYAGTYQELHDSTRTSDFP